jgi:DNA-binding NarL/FixJ family response regulator
MGTGKRMTKPYQTPISRGITVFVADDHAVVRDGLKALLATQRDLSFVGGAADGRDAVKQVRSLRPDIVIMDIVMPGLNGLDATEQIREISPSTRVIMLSMYGTSEYIYRALKAGASGYVFKRCAGQDLLDAIRVVHGGRRYLSPRATESVVDDYVQHGRSMARKSPLEGLSSRERQILQLLVEGKSSSVIARTLHLSVQTVFTYRSRMMGKLGIHDLAGLLRFALLHGLTTLE